MATTFYAFAFASVPGDLSSDNQLTMYLNTKFWRNVDGTIESNQDSVLVTFSPGAVLSAINDAITDAIVAFALNTYGWAVPRTHVIFFGFQKGLLI